MKHADKVTEIKEQLAQGAYRVEPEAVAAAILRRVAELAAARRERVTELDRAGAAEFEVT